MSESAGGALDSAPLHFYTVLVRSTLRGAVGSTYWSCASPRSDREYVDCACIRGNLGVYLIPPQLLEHLRAAPMARVLVPERSGDGRTPQPSPS